MFPNIRNLLVYENFNTRWCRFIGGNFLKTIINHKKYNILNIDKLSYASNKKEIKKLSIYKNYTFKKLIFLIIQKLIMLLINLNQIK